MGKQWKQPQTLLYCTPKSLQMVTASMKFKEASFLEKKIPITNLDSILKSREILFADKSPSSQSYGFSSSHGWMWQCRDQLYKQGFWKHDAVGEWETRYKNSVKSEDQGTNTAPRWRCQNWIWASFIVLSAVKERMCRELSYNSCSLQGQRTKWLLTTE